jgi:acyl dehydratase
MSDAGLKLEDLHVGQKFHSPERVVTAEEIRTFAAAYDPQPAHLDDTLARDTLFGGLAASGWHTAAITMRLLVDSTLNPAGGLIGAGCEDLRWPKPVRPGDVLRVEIEVLATRPSKSNATRGLATLRCTTYANDEPAQIITPTIVMQRRDSSE